MSLRQTFAELSIEVAERDKNLVILVSDISHGLFGDFRDRYPDRYLNMGICEPAIVNIAAGLNHVGLNPVVHTIAPFLIERCFEQLKLDFGYQRKSVNLVSVGASFDYSKLGCSHHSYFDVSLVSQIPDSMVFAPASVEEFRAQFLAAYKLRGIKYYRLTENPHGLSISNEESDVFRGQRLQSGSDLLFVVSGPLIRSAVEAAARLQQDGLRIEILYFPTLKPFDRGLLRESLSRIDRVLTIEDLAPGFGLHTHVLEEVAHAPQGKKVRQMAIRDFIHDYGTYDDLCKSAGLDTDSIVCAARDLL